MRILQRDRKKSRMNETHMNTWFPLVCFVGFFAVNFSKTVANFFTKYAWYTTFLKHLSECNLFTSHTQIKQCASQNPNSCLLRQQCTILCIARWQLYTNYLQKRVFLNYWNFHLLLDFICKHFRSNTRTKVSFGHCCVGQVSVWNKYLHDFGQDVWNEDVRKIISHFY